MSDARPAALRIGDVERERAAAELAEHYAQGRLSVDEHAERLEQVWAARTQADLGPVFLDLPGGTYGARSAGQARSGPQRRPRTWRFPVPLFAIVPLLLVAIIVLHAPLLVVGLLALWCLARRPRRHSRAGHCGYQGHPG